MTHSIEVSQAGNQLVITCKTCTNLYVTVSVGAGCSLDKVPVTPSEVSPPVADVTVAAPEPESPPTV